MGVVRGDASHSKGFASGGPTNEEKELGDPAAKRRRVDPDQPAPQDNGRSPHAERAEPVSVVAPWRVISMWGTEAANNEEHLERIDDLVLNESDFKYFGGQDPYDILNYALRGSLKIASVVRYVQQLVLPEVEDLRAKEVEADRLIKKMNDQLEGGVSAIEELSKALNAAKADKEQLKKKVLTEEATVKDLGKKLKLAE